MKKLASILVVIAAITAGCNKNSGNNGNMGNTMTNNNTMATTNGGPMNSAAGTMTKTNTTPSSTP